ncbi:unnamed protein product [Camellia sinensis]
MAPSLRFYHPKPNPQHQFNQTSRPPPPKKSSPFLQPFKLSSSKLSQNFKKFLIFKMLSRKLLVKSGQKILQCFPFLTNLKKLNGFLTFWSMIILIIAAPKDQNQKMIWMILVPQLFLLSQICLTFYHIPTQDKLHNICTAGIWCWASSLAWGTPTYPTGGATACFLVVCIC